MNVGDIVYCTNVDGKDVSRGTVTSQHLSRDSGYLMYDVLTDDDKERRYEDAHIHDNETSASVFIDGVSPFIDDSDKTAKVANERIDANRIKIIGEPKFIDLSNRLKEIKR